MNILVESETERELRQLFKRIDQEVEREERSVFARFPWLKKIFSVLERGAAWEPITRQFFEEIEGSYPLPDGSGKAFTGLAPSGASNMTVGPLTHYCSWKQGDLKLMLGIKESEQTAVLFVDNPQGEKVDQLCWVHEDRLGNLDEPLETHDIESLDVHRVDENHYTVEKPGLVAERLQAINRARNNAADGKVDIDLRLLLPFVEME